MTNRSNGEQPYTHCAIHEQRLDKLEAAHVGTMTNVSSLTEKVDEIHTVIGKSPDRATGTPGSGIAKTVADHDVKLDEIYRAVRRMASTVPDAAGEEPEDPAMLEHPEVTRARASVRKTKIIATTIASVLTAILGAVTAYYASTGGAP